MIQTLKKSMQISQTCKNHDWKSNWKSKTQIYYVFDALWYNNEKFLRKFYNPFYDSLSIILLYMC